MIEFQIVMMNEEKTMYTEWMKQSNEPKWMSIIYWRNECRYLLIMIDDEVLIMIDNEVHWGAVTKFHIDILVSNIGW
jgi:hypothetical protein